MCVCAMSHVLGVVSNHMWLGKSRQFVYMKKHKQMHASAFVLSVASLAALVRQAGHLQIHYTYTVLVE